jgi:type IV pilus assembly protein PilX
MKMNLHNCDFKAGPDAQRGVSLIVALVLLIVLTLIGVSSMNTAIVELKMAGSAQQQSIALNRANEMLRVGEINIQAIVDDPKSFDFSKNGDGYYTNADKIDVHKIDWGAQSLNSIKGPVTGNNDVYIAEYLGDKIPLGETKKDGTQVILGAAVHTFRITSRSATGKSALRLVQSMYVTNTQP